MWSSACSMARPSPIRRDWFNLTEAQLQLRPYTRPTMELAVAAARSPSGSLLAGKYGIGMLSIGGTSPMAMERHTENWGLYEDTARANGHVPDRKDWRVVGLFHIAETREQARQNVQFGVQAFANYFRDVATFPIIPPEVANPTDWLIETGTGCIGTPDDAIAYVDRLVAGSGGFGVLCELAQNWADWDATKKQLRADGALCSPALPAEPRIAARQLRFRDQPSCRLHRAGECGDPKGDRPPRREPRRRHAATQRRRVGRLAERDRPVAARHRVAAPRGASGAKGRPELSPDRKR